MVRTPRRSSIYAVRLTVNPTEFVLEHTGTDTVLHIDRGASAADACPATPQSGEDTPLSAFEAAGGGGGGGILSGCAVCGVLGVIELLTGRYLLVVADAEAVASGS